MDKQGGNPYESPTENEQLVAHDWLRIMEFGIGALFLFALSAPIYYYLDANFGAVASGIAAIAVIRAGIDVRRRWTADCLPIGGSCRSLAISLSIVLLTGVATFIASFTVCFAAASIFNGLYDRNVGLLVVLCFGSGGVVGLAVASALLFYWRPASEAKLEQQREKMSDQSSGQSTSPTDNEADRHE